MLPLRLAGLAAEAEVNASSLGLGSKSEFQKGEPLSTDA
jgi:hypothetical protein